MTNTMTKYTATVKRIEAKSCRLVRVGKYVTHSNGDADYFQPQCSCGWEGTLYSNRTVEGRHLAKRNAADHAKAHNGQELDR